MNPQKRRSTRNQKKHQTNRVEWILKNAPDPKLREAFSSARTPPDWTKKGGFLSLLLKESLEVRMKAKLEAHLGYALNDRLNQKTSHCRIGFDSKGLRTSQGEWELHMPRD